LARVSFDFRGIYPLPYLVVIDLHLHTLFSDGSLVPAELIRRADVKGYRALAITDHADASNLSFVLQGARAAAEALEGQTGVQVIAGVELTHVPPSQIADLVAEARALGARWVVVHGETIVEPVRPGTNRAAIEAGCDLLSHPGLVTEDDGALAAARNVALELSGRKGHCLANGHVARIARKTGAKLLINSDGHDPGDLMTREEADRVGRGAGLDSSELLKAWQYAEQVVADRTG